MMKRQEHPRSDAPDTLMVDEHRQRPRARARWIALAVLLGAGCLGGDKQTSATGASGSTSEATSSSVTSEGTTGSSTSASSTTTDAGSGTSGTTTTTGPEVCEAVETYGDETSGGAEQCDTFTQECPPCQKCTAWSDDGFGGWNTHRCVPLVPDPKQALEPCTVQGSYNSGLDECDEGLMCWNVDESNAGYCVALCAGSPEEPLCPYPGECMIFADGVAPKCFPACDPLLQDCPGEDVCYYIHDAWLCTQDVSGPDAGVDGDPCDWENACDPGLLCAEGNSVPGCEGFKCCATICDLDLPNTCPLKAQGAECVPFYAMGEAPPGKENVGFCGLP
ncbi:MAG: hypothetical protein H6711_04055 [Myxococcales bacterium]|nr:hypothetical protein [Myxococcales bacterium]